MGFTNWFYICTFICANYLFLSVSAQSGQVIPRPRTIRDNECEEIGANGQIEYAACISEALHLLRSTNAQFNLTVDPANATCGTPRMSYCTLVRK